MSAPPTTLFRAILELDIGDSDPADVQAAWQHTAQVVSRHPANLAQSLNADAEHPTIFYIISDWASAEEFRAFASSAEHRASVGDLRRIARAVVMRTMIRVLAVPAADGEERP